MRILLLLVVLVAFSAITATGIAEDGIATGKTQSAASAIRFMSYDVNPRKPDDVTVGVNVRATGRSHFKQIGEAIPGTAFRVKKVIPKTSAGPNGVTKDETQLILVDTATNQEVVFPISQTVEAIVPKAN